MELKKFQELLKEMSVLRPQAVETTIFSAGGRGYYENPTSDLLAFFLYPHGGHGLDDLVLSSLIECVADELPCDRPTLVNLKEPQREYKTQHGNRIDILLEGSDWVMAIENKIRHGLNNPWGEYEDTINNNFPGKRRYLVILAPYRSRIDHWSWIPYQNLVAKTREKLGRRIIASGISKWAIFLREFLLNIEEEVELMGRPMDDQQFKFVREHYREIRDALALHDAYIARLKEEIRAIGTESLGAEPARIEQHDWGDHGIALQLYPRADRLHCSTFLVLRDGHFRVQFYIQADARRPADLARIVFTDSERFEDWGDEKSGALWVFAADDTGLENALNTFRTSLALLRNNTD